MNSRKFILDRIKNNSAHLRDFLDYHPSRDNPPKIPKKFFVKREIVIKKFINQLNKAHGKVEILTKSNNFKKIKNKFNIKDDKLLNLSTIIKNNSKKEGAISPEKFILNQAKLSKLEWGLMDGEIGVEENGAIWVNLTKLGKVIHSSMPFLIENLIIVLPKERLVKSMHQAYLYLSKKNKNKLNGIFIAGPSKTGDIEHNLVVGAHGAKQLLVVIR